MAVPNSRYSYPLQDSELPSFSCFPPRSGHYWRPVHRFHRRTIHAQHGLSRLLSRTRNRFSKCSAWLQECGLGRYRVPQPCTRCGSEVSQRPNRATVCCRGVPNRNHHDCSSGGPQLSCQHHALHTVRQYPSIKRVRSELVVAISSVVPTLRGRLGRSRLPSRILPAGSSERLRSGQCPDTAVSRRRQRQPQFVADRDSRSVADTKVDACRFLTE